MTICSNPKNFSYFPNLTKLVIIGSELESLTKVEFCYQLTELWLCEAGLQNVPDLSDCSNLQKLLLYQNDLKVLTNLEPLDNLQVRSELNMLITIVGVGPTEELKLSQSERFDSKLLSPSLMFCLDLCVLFPL